VTPNVTKNGKGRSGNLDHRTTRQPGHAVSLSRRWLIERGLQMAQADQPAAASDGLMIGRYEVLSPLLLDKGRISQR